MDLDARLAQEWMKNNPQYFKEMENPHDQPSTIHIEYGRDKNMFWNKR